MERGYVRGFDAVAKAELWERWRRGESLKAIGRAFGKPSSSIYFQVAPHGGIRPAPRRRSRLALTLSEREEILRGIAGARSMRSIARLLGRAPSTVSREIKRNGGYDRYRAATADENAWRRGRRPKGCKLTNNRWLRRTVTRNLESDWSPEQIAGWLKRAYPEDEYQVTRDDLSQFVCASPRCSEERTYSPSSLEADDAPAETSGRQARANRGSSVDQQATGNG
jgi:IS30 family transposase